MRGLGKGGYFVFEREAKRLRHGDFGLRLRCWSSSWQVRYLMQAIRSLSVLLISQRCRLDGVSRCPLWLYRPILDVRLLLLPIMMIFAIGYVRDVGAFLNIELTSRVESTRSLLVLLCSTWCRKQIAGLQARHHGIVRGMLAPYPRNFADDRGYNLDPITWRSFWWNEVFLIAHQAINNGGFNIVDRDRLWPHI